MNYKQTQALFETMDDLETYAKMYQRELSKDDCDMEAANRYSGCIIGARETLFELMQEQLYLAQGN